MKSASLLGLLLLFSLSACSRAPTRTADSERLASIITEYTEASKRADPFYASYFNVEENLGTFGDYPAPEYFARWKGIYDRALAALGGVDVTRLSEKDLRAYRIFKEDLEIGVREFEFSHALDFHQMSNRLMRYIDDSSEALTSFPFDSVKHYDDFVRRSEGFPAYIDRQIALLESGVREGVVLSCVAAKATRVTFQEGLEARVEKNPFYRPVIFMPKTFSEADRNRIAADFSKMVSERIVPGFRKFDAYFGKKYLPHCRKSFGIGALPRGKEWYRYSVLASTGLPLDPEEIHQTGLREVARIQTELEKVKQQLGFKGTYREFLSSVSKDPKYFFKTAKEMFEAFARVKTTVAERIPSLFSLVPKSDYQVVESANPEDAAGRYRQPTELQPYGRFIVNTANLRSVPVYAVTTLSLHEAVPGHHFQLALQFENRDEISEYQRKLFSSNAFVEGWALYSEYLGNEMGLFADPVQRLGHLNDEMLRAVRLVVDSGIHAKSWSREKVLAYMGRYLAHDPKNISNEANRYSVMPGQALGYKIGQLRILELRRMAEKELGPKFDVRGFHRAVIGSGAVSLTVLEAQVRDWIRVTKEKS
jgi:uncharacterized protein (DUF885 family)